MVRYFGKERESVRLGVGKKINEKKKICKKERRDKVISKI